MRERAYFTQNTSFDKLLINKKGKANQKRTKSTLYIKEKKNENIKQAEIFITTQKKKVKTNKKVSVLCENCK